MWTQYNPCNLGNLEERIRRMSNKKNLVEKEVAQALNSNDGAIKRKGRLNICVGFVVITIWHISLYS